MNRTPLVVAAVDDVRLLDALPIAAGIFTLQHGKLWLEAMNSRFVELAQCKGAPENFAETFKRYAKGDGGKFVMAFFADPAGAPDEIEIAEGEGVSRQFLTLKVAPLTPAPNGTARCLLSVVDRTVEVRA